MGTNEKSKAIKAMDPCGEVMFALTLKKRIRRWILLIIICFVVLMSPSHDQSEHISLQQRHIAKVHITGGVEGLSDAWYQQLEILYNNKNAAALILVIDSPGGAVSVADAGYSLIKRIHRRIPVATVVSGMAASAGYMMAIAGDVVIARQTSVVGSIGVLLQIPVFKNLLENIGIEYRNVGVGDTLEVVPFKGLSDFTNKYLDLSGEDSYQWFRSVVKYERRLTDKQLAKVIGGKIFLGYEAIKLGLIDGFGDISTARKWLASYDSSLNERLAVVDYGSLTAN